MPARNGEALRVGQHVVERPGAVGARGPDQLHRRVVRTALDRLVDAGGARRAARLDHVVDHLEDRAHRRLEPLAAAVPGGLVVGHDGLAGGPVVVDVAHHAVPPGPDAGEDRGVVGERDARELRDRAAAQRRAPLDEPGQAGQLAGLCQVQEVAGGGAVPEDADHVAGPAAVEVRRERAAVERVAVGVGEGRLGHPGQHRERGADVDQPGVVVHEAAAGDAGAAEHQRRPGLDHVERAVLPDVAAVLEELVPRGVHDRQVGAALGVGEERPQPRGGVRVGVAGRQRRRGVGHLPLVGQEGHRVLAADRVGAVLDDPGVVGVPADPAEVVGGVRRAVLDPDHEVDDRGQLRGAERRHRLLAVRGADVGLRGHVSPRPRRRRRRAPRRSRASPRRASSSADVQRRHHVDAVVVGERQHAELLARGDDGVHRVAGPAVRRQRLARRGVGDQLDRPERAGATDLADARVGRGDRRQAGPEDLAAEAVGVLDDPLVVAWSRWWRPRPRRRAGGRSRSARRGRPGRRTWPRSASLMTTPPSGT